MEIIKVLASEFKKEVWQIENSVALMDEGCTIPFIARYRKEKTGELDDQILREIFDRLTYLRNLEQRKEEVIKSITEQEKMTDEIMDMLSRAKTLSEVEDIYRPFKPKRKTRASVAKEKGLEPLAKEILEQRPLAVPEDLAADYINEEILVMLKKYGVRTIELGVQSMIDSVLSANDRGHSAAQS